MANISDTDFLGGSFSEGAGGYIDSSTGGDGGWSWGGGGMDNGDIFSGGNYGGGNYNWDPMTGGFSDYFSNDVNNGTLYDGGQSLNSMFGEAALAGDPGWGRTQYTDAQQQGAVENSFTGYEQFQNFFRRNPAIRMLLALHPIGRMVNAAAGGGKSIGGFLGSMFGAQAGGIPGAIIGGYGGSRIGEMATTGSTNWTPSGTEIGGTVGSFLGGNITGNPIGSVLGGQLGAQLGNQSGGFTPSTGSGSMINPVTGVSNSAGIDTLNQSLLGAGAGLYNYMTRNNEVNKQINGLEALYSQNSPYAQQMRQALERKDAASGRRSQYGTREVELQAALANQASRMAPTLQQLYQQKQLQRGTALNSILRNPEVVKYLSSGLGSLFNAQPTYNPVADFGPGYTESNPAIGQVINSGNAFGDNTDWWNG